MAGVVIPSQTQQTLVPVSRFSGNSVFHSKTATFLTPGDRTSLQAACKLTPEKCSKMLYSASERNTSVFCFSGLNTTTSQKVAYGLNSMVSPKATYDLNSTDPRETDGETEQRSETTLPYTDSRKTHGETEQRSESTMQDRSLLTSGHVSKGVETSLEHPYSHLFVRQRWKEIQGANFWNGLLDPIDLLVKSEIVRYGEFAQSTYDAFDYDQHSKFCGSCKFNKNRLLESVNLENRGYTVTTYLYATLSNSNLTNFLTRSDSEKPWSRSSNWIGYIAVSTDPLEITRLGRRDIVVVWRGTVTKLEWIADLKDVLMPLAWGRRKGKGGVVDLKVESGFLDLYTARSPESRFNKRSAREQVLWAVSSLVEKYKDEDLSITITGHSLGSSLAILSAYDLAESRINSRDSSVKVSENWDEEMLDGQCELDPARGLETIPITVYSFAGPRVGNQAFCDRILELGVKVLRVVNKHDTVPSTPGVLANEGLGAIRRFLDWFPWTYSHVGVKLEIDNLKSPSLKKTINPVGAHNLEAYLHLLDGYQDSNPDSEFTPTLNRDIALVNKNSNLLDTRFYIPPYWWQEAYKGMVQTVKNRWVLRPRLSDDIPREVDHIDHHLP